MSVMKTWNGSAWVSHTGWLKPKVWNGSAWVRFRPVIWLGSGWEVVSVPQSRTITVGSAFITGNKFAPSGNMYGYNFTDPAIGSISDTSLALWPGGIITALNWFEGSQAVILSVNTTAPSNSAFTTLTINGTAFSRTAGSYSGGTSAHSWSWTTATNPFGTSGNITVSWA